MVGLVEVPVGFQDFVHWATISSVLVVCCHCAVTGYNKCCSFVSLGSTVFGYLEVVIVYTVIHVVSVVAVSVIPVSSVMPIIVV